MSWRSWLRKVRTRPGNREEWRQQRRRFRPRIEFLEDRTLLNAVSWASTTSGNWDDPTKWSGGAVPTAADDVTINQPGVTITVEAGSQAAHTLTGSDALALSGGALTVGAASTFAGSATVNVGSTLTLSADTTLSGTVAVSGGTLTANGKLTLAGPATWGSGSIGGSGSIATSSTGALNAAGSGTLTLALPLNNAATVDVQSGTLSITAAVTQVSGTTLTGGTWDVANNATLTLGSTPNLTASQANVTLAGPNAVFTQFAPVTNLGGSLALTGGANFSAAGNLTVSGSVSLDTGTLQLNNQALAIGSGGSLSLGSVNGLGGETQVTNAGTFTLSGGSGTLTISAPFNNQSGTIAVQSGTLDLTNGGTWTGGTLNANGTGVLALAGSPTLTGSYSGSGTGTVLLSNRLNIGAQESDTASFDFPSGMLQINGGQITGPGTLSNAAGGFLTVSGSNGGSFNAPVNNAGTITVTGAGGLGLAASPLTNQAGGVLDLTNTGSVAVSGGNNHDLINAGTINVSASGTTVLAAGFDNTGGTIDVQSGILQIVSPRGVADFWSGGGTLNVTSGATLQLTNTLFNTDITVAGNYSGIGGGQILFQSTIHAGAQSSDTATFNFAPGMFQWQNGTFTGPGTITNAGDMQLVNQSFKSIAGGTFINTGTMTWNFKGSGDFGGIAIDSSSQMINRGTVHWIDALLGGDLTNEVGGTISLEGTTGTPDVFGSVPLANKGTIVVKNASGLTLGAGGSGGIAPGTLFNAAGGLIDLQSDVGIDIPVGFGQVINAGTVRKSGGTGTSTLGPFFFDHENGTIDVETGTIAIPLSGEISTGGTFNVAANAVLDLSGNGGENSLVGTYTGSGAGHVELTHGELAVGARHAGDLDTAVLDLTGGGFLWTGGLLGAQNSTTSTLTNEGQFTVAPGIAVEDDAPLINQGTLTVDAGSTLNVANTYTQTSTGTLSVQLGGTGSGQSGKLVSTGAAQLDGTLQATLVNGYSPAVGDSVTVQQYPSATGTYAHFNLPASAGIGFAAAVQPTGVVLTGAALATDLAVQSIDSITPAPGIAGQNETVQYTDVNNGKATPVSSWEDSVFLTMSTTLDASAVLLGRVPHTSAVATGGTYHGTLTAPVPGVLPGSYHVIVETDSQGVVPDSNRADNVLASAGTLPVDFNVLTLGGSARGTIASGQDVYFKLNLPAGQNVELSTSLGAAGAAELFVGYQSVPTPSMFQESAVAANPSTQSLTLAATQAGTYFLLLAGQPGAGTGTSFTLAAQELSLAITSLSPSTTALGGPIFQAGRPVSSFDPAFAGSPVTVTIRGHDFSARTTASLVKGGITVPAQQVFFTDPDTIEATFRNIPSAGTYDVQVNDNGHTATDAGAFTVSPGSTSQVTDAVQVHFSIPSGARAGATTTLLLTYQNTTAVDAPAPLIFLFGDNASFQLPGETGFIPGGLLLLAISHHGPAGIIPAGGSDSLTVNFQETDTTDINMVVVDPNTPNDLDALQSQLQPPNVPTAAWNAIYPVFLQKVGLMLLCQLGESFQERADLI
jgi:hypothetical protein